MSRGVPAHFASWDEADAAFDLFMANMPLRRQQLRDRIAATDGPELDLSLESLGPLCAWFIATAQQDADDSLDWRPSWLPPVKAGWQPNPLYPRLPSPQLLRLWGLVGIYVGDVVVPLIPHARWVCWRAAKPRELTSGAFVLDQGDSAFPFDVLNASEPGIVAWQVHRGTPRAPARPPNPRYIESRILAALEQREELRGDRPLTWQKAPTGPLASKRTRTPDW